MGDEAVGLGIVRRALEAPIRQIADNAGAHGEVVVEHVKRPRPGQGYDALKGEYGDMFAKGIVDAAKVTRSALQNAASIAGMVLTTETVITDLPEKKHCRSGRGRRLRRRHGLLKRNSRRMEAGRSARSSSTPAPTLDHPSRASPADGHPDDVVRPGAGQRRLTAIRVSYLAPLRGSMTIPASAGQAGRDAGGPTAPTP